MADVVVVGPGGVGGFLAAMLAAGGLEVAVVGRGAHADAIERDGLRLDDPQRPELLAAGQRVAVARSLGEAPPADVVVLAVKHSSLPVVSRELPTWLAAAGDQAVALAVQNGVSHLDGALPAAAPGRLLVGSVYIFSHVEEPGLVRCLGGPRLYRFGPLDAGDPALLPRAEAIAARWKAAGLNAAADPDGRRVAWDKLCLLAPLSGLTALTGRTVGELRDQPQAMRTYQAIAEEVRGVAVAQGVPVDAAVAANAIRTIRATDPAGRSSLYRDMEAGRESEAEVLLGDPLRRAETAGVDAPALRAVYAATLARYGLSEAVVGPGAP